LEYNIIEISEIEKEVEFLVSKEELNPYLDEELEKLRKDVTIKGYRKGRVPKNIIKALYKETIRTNALNSLINQYYQKLLEEKNWQPAGDVELLKLEEDDDKIKFRLKIEIMPDFNVENYLGLELFKNKPLPLEYIYEETIENLRESYASVRETDEPAAVDNFVTLDLEVIKDNKVNEQKKDITVKVGDRSLPDDLNRALVGIKKGVKRQIKIDDSTYRINVKRVEEKILPQVDDEFAHLLDCENIEELKKRIMEEAKEKEENRLREELEESLARILLERNHFPVPKSLINFEYQLILKAHNLVDSESNKERFWEIAEKRARFNLIIEKIAQKENIKTEDSEVMEILNKSSQEIKEDRKGAIEYLRKILTKAKTIDFLINNAVIIEQERLFIPRR